MNSLKPPEELSLQGNVADNFKKWRQMFGIYFEASGILVDITDSPNTKVTILLLSIGSKAVEVYNTLQLTEEEKCDYKKELDKLASNATVTRHIFFKRMQNKGENVYIFVTDLKKLSVVSNFGVAECADIQVKQLEGKTEVFRVKKISASPQRGMSQEFCPAGEKCSVIPRTQSKGERGESFQFSRSTCKACGVSAQPFTNSATIE
ncbi:hypothetical protein PR048_011183, partial [Dryococelus australis]